MDNTQLTLRDLNTITDSFVTTLHGAYHPRINYPEMGQENPPIKMINIEIKSSVKQTIIPDMLEQAARATLILKYTSTDASLTVVLSNDSHLQELNRKYRGIDTPTDVLSFQRLKPILKLVRPT